jgi:hypothetical protein
VWQVLLTLIFIFTTIGQSQAEPLPYGLEDSPETRLALAASLAAKSELNGVAYSWYSLDLAQCSGFVSRYLSYLGLPVELITESPKRYQPENGSPIPASSTHMQVARFRLLDQEVGGGYTLSLTVAELLEHPDEWLTLYGIQPGSLIYWTKAEAQIEYNGWVHVVILIGYTDTGEPVMADFAAGMNKGPMVGRSLREVANGLYWSNQANGWDLSPYPTNSNPDPLRVFVVDTLSIIESVQEAGVFGGNND